MGPAYRLAYDSPNRTNHSRPSTQSTRRFGGSNGTRTGQRSRCSGTGGRAYNIAIIRTKLPCQTRKTVIQTPPLPANHCEDQAFRSSGVDFGWRPGDDGRAHHSKTGKSSPIACGGRNRRPVERRLRFRPCAITSMNCLGSAIHGAKSRRNGASSLRLRPA
jgi:hypothetical protein